MTRSRAPLRQDRSCGRWSTWNRTGYADRARWQLGLNESLQNLIRRVEKQPPDACEISCLPRPMLVLARMSLEYCCLARNFTQDDATMQERFEISIKALGLDMADSDEINAVRALGEKSKHP